MQVAEMCGDTPVIFRRIAQIEVTRQNNRAGIIHSTLDKVFDFEATLFNSASLALVAAGAVTDSGAVRISNGMSIDAGANSVTLDNAGNDFADSGSGDNVDITWTAGANAQDYLLELRVCQNGNLVDLAFLDSGLSFSVLDEAGCSGQRMGELFAHNNAGYSPPVTIPWP